MTAVLHDDAVTNPPAVRPAAAPSPAETAKRPHRRPANAGGDPLVDGAARLLSIPLRQVYAVLWRVGLIEVTA